MPSPSGEESRHVEEADRLGDNRDDVKQRDRHHHDHKGEGEGDRHHHDHKGEGEGGCFTGKHFHRGAVPLSVLVLTALCIALYCAQITLIAYGLSGYQKFLGISTAQKDEFLDESAYAYDWNPADMGVRFLPPASIASWINTGCDNGTTVASPNPSGCKFANLWKLRLVGNCSTLDQFNAVGSGCVLDTETGFEFPTDFNLFGAFGSSVQEPIAPLLLSSFIVSLVAGAFGLVACSIEIFELRGYLKHGATQPKGIKLFWIVDTCLTIPDVALLLACFILVFAGRPTTLSPSFYLLNGYSVPSGDVVFAETNSSIHDDNDPDIEDNFNSYTGSLRRECDVGTYGEDFDTSAVWFYISDVTSFPSSQDPTISFTFPMGFVHVDCDTPLQDQLLWLAAWKAHFDYYSEEGLPAWEICDYHNFTIDTVNSCITYDCSSGSFRSKDGLGSKVKKKIESKMYQAIAFDASGVGSGVVAYIILYAVIPHLMPDDHHHHGHGDDDDESDGKHPHVVEVRRHGDPEELDLEVVQHDELQTP